MNLFPIADKRAPWLLRYMWKAVSYEIGLENAHGCTPRNISIFLFTLPEGLLQLAEFTGTPGVTHGQKRVQVPDMWKRVQI